MLFDCIFSSLICIFRFFYGFWRGWGEFCVEMEWQDLLGRDPSWLIPLCNTIVLDFLVPGVFLGYHFQRRGKQHLFDPMVLLFFCLKAHGLDDLFLKCAYLVLGRWGGWLGGRLQGGLRNPLDCLHLRIAILKSTPVILEQYLSFVRYGG